MPQMPPPAEIEAARQFFRSVAEHSPFAVVAHDAATLLQYVEWLERDVPVQGDQFDGTNS